MNPSRPAVALAGAIVMLAGCQSYEPKPLDLASHRDMWSARMPGDEPVRAFAERLAASGQPSVFDPSDGLSLAEGELVALVYNPDLRLARLRAGISAATADHAGLWDDPQLTVDFLQVTESIPNPYFITPGLAFTIPISGRLDAEKERADAVLAAELTRVAEVEWAVRIEVRQTWLRWSAAKMRAEQTEQLLASIESLVGSTSRLAEAGEMLQTEAALFTIERASQSRVLLKFRGDAAEVEQRLRSLLGVSPDAPLELQSTLVATTDFDQPTAGAAAERNLTLVRLRDEYEVAERTLYREVRKQYPDLTIGPLADFDQGQTMLGFSLALPIPILNANKQGIAQAIAERELARAAFETEYDRLVGSLAATQVRIETLREQRNLIESEIAPLVDRQLGDAQRLLGLGEGEGLILLESLSRVGQTRMELIETRLAESLAESELSHLLGPPSPSIETSENPTDQHATTAGHAGSRLPKVTP